MRERMIEGVESALGRDGEVECRLGRSVEQLDARAVVVGIPEEGDLEAAADTVCELAPRVVVAEQHALHEFSLS
jgi:hypothetical protein